MVSFCNLVLLAVNLMMAPCGQQTTFHHHRSPEHCLFVSGKSSIDSFRSRRSGWDYQACTDYKPPCFSSCYLRSWAVGMVTCLNIPAPLLLSCLYINLFGFLFQLYFYLPIFFSIIQKSNTKFNITPWDLNLKSYCLPNN